MVDESKKLAGTGTIAASNPGEISSLESYIGTNGPINWRECLVLFHDVCFKMEKEPEVSEIGKLTIHSFIVRKLDTISGISIEILSNFDEGLDVLLESQNQPKEYSFPPEAYMSPEQCLERPLNRRSDVYSLGCVIYHCLTGAPPFLHRDPEKLKEMQTIDYALPPGRRSQRRVIPDEVDMLISNCLEKDPARRVKNAGQLRANIGRVLQLEDESDEPPFQSTKFAEFAKRKRNIFYSVVALVAVTAGVGWLSLKITSSADFQKLINKTLDRQRNKFFLSVEDGPKFLEQAEFENGKMEPDKDKDPIYVKVKGEDTILFATTKRKTMKEALEEAVRRRLIIYKADLYGQDFQGSKLSGGKLESCFFVECNLDGASFKGSYLKGAIFAGSTMKDANLDSANAPEAVFQGCNLEGANLANTILLDCDFSKANLKNADFSNSKLLNSNFEGADLTGANFTGATLAKYGLETANLTEEQKSKLIVIEGPKGGPKRHNQPEKSAGGLNPGKQNTFRNLKELNPFSNPVEGTDSFGPDKNAPIGLDFDPNNLPPAPPRKTRSVKPSPPAVPEQNPAVPNSPAPESTNVPPGSPVQPKQP